MDVHFGDVVDTVPFCGWVLGVAVIQWDFEVGHVAVGGWVDISIKTLKHFAFGFGLNDTSDDASNVLFALGGEVDLALGEELVPMLVCLIYDFPKLSLRFT